jgi:hypothetical protein
MKALKFLRDMWRHLVAMSLVLALMSLALVALERAANNREPTSVGESRPMQSSDAQGGSDIDILWFTD